MIALKISAAFSPVFTPSCICPLCGQDFPYSSMEEASAATASEQQMAIEEHLLTFHKALSAHLPENSKYPLELDFLVPNLTSPRKITVLLKKKPDIMAVGVCILSAGPCVGFVVYECIGNPGLVSVSTTNFKTNYSGPALSPSVSIEDAMDSQAAFSLKQSESPEEFSKIVNGKANLKLNVYFGSPLPSPENKRLLKRAGAMFFQ